MMTVHVCFGDTIAEFTGERLIVQWTRDLVRVRDLESDRPGQVHGEFPRDSVSAVYRTPPTVQIRAAKR